MLLPPLLLMSVLASAPAHDSWERTFDPTRVAQYLPQGAQRVIVIGVGEAAPIASTLANALHISPTSPHVMSAASLGDVSDLADRSILARAARFPFTQLIVVRKLPASAVRRSEVKVVSYDSAGNESFAFTAVAGEPAPLSPRGPALSKAAPPRTAKFEWRRVLSGAQLLALVPSMATMAIFIRGYDPDGAATALERAINGPFRFIGIESVSKGSAEDGSDAELIAPAIGKVTRIAVVRTVGTPDKHRAPSVTVSFYAENGAPIETLYSTDGKPLERIFFAEGEYAYDPVAIYGNDATEAELDQMLTIEHSVYHRVGGPSAHTFSLQVGRKRLPVSIGRLLRLIEREDLLEVQLANDRRSQTRYALALASIGIGLGGMLLLTVPRDLPDPFGEGASNPLNVALAVPLGIGGLISGLYFFVTASRYTNVIDVYRMFDMAALHNERVIRGLTPKPRSPRRPVPKVQLSIGLEGVQLAGVF